MEWEASQPHQPHKQALMDATVAGENLKGAMLIGKFEISPDMEAERQGVLARVHEITRTVRTTDQDILDKVFSMGLRSADCPEFRILADLRDRYEGLGKYAPLPVVTPAAKPTDPRRQKQKEPANAND